VLALLKNREYEISGRLLCIPRDFYYLPYIKV
jgi:hypothetical protein